MSDKDLHIIRDHCYHEKHIMGGMWGVRNHKIEDMEGKMKIFLNNKSNYRTHTGDDQDFLRDNFYHKYKDNTLVHIGPQHGINGNFLPRGRYPEEKHILSIILWKTGLMMR